MSWNYIPVLFVLLCLVPTSAEAQRGQREPLLSERAFGLGGAMVASSAGPSAAYYNPAGLADTPGTSAGATLSLRTYRQYTLVDGYNSVLGLEDLVDSGLLSIPIFLGAVLKFGDRDETNVRQHALAAGMLIRDFDQRELLSEAFDLARGFLGTLEVADNQETRWFYASYAARPSNQLSFGGTVALAVFDREYRESWTQAIGLVPGMDRGLLSTRRARLDISSTSLLARLGASFRPAEWIQLSVMFQTPGIEVLDSGSSFFHRTTVNHEPTGEPSGFFHSADGSIDVQATIPWQLRIGTYMRFDPVLGVGLDLGLTGSEGAANSPINPLGEPIPSDGDRPAATYLADEYWTDVAFDVALGAEIRLSDEVPLRVGTFFELSGLPTAVGTRDAYLPDRVDRFGLTAAVGAQGDRYDFGVGVGYVYGFGTGLRPADAFGGGYVGTSVQSHEITIFLSGVTGAATQLALDTYTAITGHGFSDDEVSDDALDHVEELQDPAQVEQEREERRLEYENLPSWILEALEADPDAEEPAEPVDPTIGDHTGSDLLEGLDAEDAPEAEEPAAEGEPSAPDAE